jgi:hypothetical protein
VKKIIISGITDPAFYGYRIVYFGIRLDNSLSVLNRTLMEHVAQWTVVQNHDFTQVRLNRAQIFDERTMAECTVLPVVSTRKELALLLQVVYHWICVFLH